MATENIKELRPETIPQTPLPLIDFVDVFSESDPTAASNTEYFPTSISDTGLPYETSVKQVVNDSLDTQARRIKGTYKFTESGALKIGGVTAGVQGEILISPDGIFGKNSSGVVTFSIDGTTGAATFLGTVAAGSVISAEVAATLITGQIVNAQIANIAYAKITSVAVDTADIVSAAITSAKIEDAAITNAKINDLSADKIDVGTLAGISIIGNIIKTSSTGQRIEMNDTDNEVAFYNPSGTKKGLMEADSSKMIVQSLSDILLLEAGTEELQLKTGNGVITLISGANAHDFSIGSADVTLNTLLKANGFHANGQDITNIDELKGGDGYLDMNSGNGNTQVKHLDPSSSNTYNLGGSSRYWNAVNTKDLTKFAGGTWGYYDQGVEMPDGRILPDTEALLAMTKHPTIKTSYGAPSYDFESLPKVIQVIPKKKDGTNMDKDSEGQYFQVELVKQKYSDGRVKRDKLGEPVFKEEKVIHETGENVFATISIVLGAVKEVALGIKDIKARLSVLEGDSNE